MRSTNNAMYLLIVPLTRISPSHNGSPGPESTLPEKMFVFRSCSEIKVAACACRRNSSPADLVEDPERTARGRLAEEGLVLAIEVLYDIRPLGRDKNTTSMSKYMTELFMNERVP